MEWAIRRVEGGKVGRNAKLCWMYVLRYRIRGLFTWTPRWEDPGNSRRPIRNNTQRLHSRARLVNLVNEITKSKGAWGVASLAWRWLYHTSVAPGSPKES